MMKSHSRRRFFEVCSKSEGGNGEQGKTDVDWRDKSADVRRADCGWRVGFSRHHKKSPAVAFCKTPSDSICIRAVSGFDTASSSHETARRPSARSSWPHSR